MQFCAGLFFQPGTPVAPKADGRRRPPFTELPPLNRKGGTPGKNALKQPLPHEIWRFDMQRSLKAVLAPCAAATAAALVALAVLPGPAPAAPSAGDANPAGGAEAMQGVWSSRQDRQGVTAVRNADGSLTITTSYYSLVLPSGWADQASWCYDDGVFALAMDADHPDNRSSWSWIACYLLVSVPDGDGVDQVGIYLARAGEDAKVLTSASQAAVGQVVGEAAVGDGWSVVAYALGRPDDESGATQALLDTVVANTTPQGSSTQPPTEPKDMKAVIGG